MKIIRDGKEFELTQQELREAYTEKHMEYLREDVASQAESDEITLDEGDLDIIADRFENALGKCDGYWDHYWNVMHYVISEYAKEAK
jgi:hypothetical protein